MLEKIIDFDTRLFLELNSHHSPFFDILMVLFSKTTFWLPLLFIIIFLIFRKYKRKGIVITLLIAVVITIADQTSVHWFKEVFERLRPCHNEAINHLLHNVNNHCGGRYGFVSSHAANTFAVAVYTLLLLKNRLFSILILFWAALVSYSRIYLGVHYPADILGGALLGTLAGSVVYYIYFWIDNKKT